MRILFLDLDGTVRRSNKPSGFINKAEDVEVYPEAKRVIEGFVELGWKVCYISNQGGIDEGFTTVDDFIKGIYRTDDLLGGLLHSIQFCHHKVDAGCICRKPRPGMVVKALLILGTDKVDVRKCLFVGDRPEDEGCAKACGIPFMDAGEWRGLDVG